MCVYIYICCLHQDKHEIHITCWLWYSPIWGKHWFVWHQVLANIQFNSICLCWIRARLHSFTGIHGNRLDKMYDVMWNYMYSHPGLCAIKQQYSIDCVTEIINLQFPEIMIDVHWVILRGCVFIAGPTSSPLPQPYSTWVTPCNDSVGGESFWGSLAPRPPLFCSLDARSRRAAAFVHYEWEWGYFERWFVKVTSWW